MKHIFITYSRFVFVLIVMMGMIVPSSLFATGLPTTDFLQVAQNAIGATTDSTIAANSTKEVVKDTFLDALASSIANMLMQKIVRGTVKWVNSGFEGNPFYVQNPQLLKSNVFYQQATLVADQIRNNIEAGFNREVLMALGKAFFTNPYSDLEFTLDDTLGNDWQGFTNGDSFSWDGYLVLGEKANNVISATFNARRAILDGIDGQIDRGKGILERELEQGAGFFGDKECVREQELSDGTTICLEYRTKTPGSVIANQITESLNIPADQIGKIDEITELAGTAITQLTSGLLDLGLSKLSTAAFGGDNQDSVLDAQSSFYNITSVESDSNQSASSSGGGSYDTNYSPFTVNIDQMLYGNPRKEPVVKPGTSPVALPPETLNQTLGRLGMIGRIQEGIDILLEEQRLLSSTHGIIQTIDQQCLLGPDRGFEERFREPYQLLLGKQQRKSAKSNEKADALMNAYESLFAFFINWNHEQMSADPFSLRMKIAVDEVENYNDRLSQISGFLTRFRGAQARLLTLAEEYKDKTRNSDEIALTLTRLSQSGNIPTVDMLLSMIDDVETAKSNVGRVIATRDSCLVEVQDPLYTIRKYADEEELLYCPFEGLVAATAPVNGRKKSSNASAYFNHLHWGLERPSFLNREAEGREDIWQGSNSNDLLMGGNMVFFGLPWLSPDGIINFHGAETSDNMRDPKSYVFKNDKDKDDIEFYGKNYPKYDFNLGFDDEDEDTNPTNERMKIKCSTGYRSNITDYLSLQAY